MGLNDAEAADIAVGAAGLDSVELVGMDLFRGQLLGLELAGIILLVALVGAVVLARQRIVPEPPTAGNNRTRHDQSNHDQSEQGGETANGSAARFP
jgi:hypothetical protein